MTNPKLADKLTALAEKAGTFGDPSDREARDEILRLVPTLIAALTARSDGWREGVERLERAGSAVLSAMDTYNEKHGTHIGGPAFFELGRAIAAIRSLAPPETTP